MKTMTGCALHSRCRLTSAFHSTRQEYANLWKCAPFVLGSTLRGALLSYLIATHYSTPEIQAGTYQKHGIVGPFFASPPRAYFSFGRFPDGVEGWMESHARIGIEREHGSVAEGALLSVEAVPAGTGFEFDVLLPGDDGTLAQVVEKGVRQMSGRTGLGGLRSVGLGQFEVREVITYPLADYLADVQAALAVSLDAKRLQLTFTTPYVLADGQLPWRGDLLLLAQRVGEELGRVVEASGLGLTVPAVERVDALLRPEFVGRWSYERGCRENRLVAWPGSTFTVQLGDSGESGMVLSLGQAFGIGEWSEWGFGRFKLESERA